MRRMRLAVVAGVMVGAGAMGAALLGQQVPVSGVPGWKSVEDYHAKTVERFVQAPDFGVSRVPRMNVLDLKLPVQIGEKSYHVTGTHLVSVLKNDPAKVYEQAVPHVEQARALKDAKDVKTRDLSTFESKALAELKKGKDLVTDTTGKLPVALGALRADASCIACHKDKAKGDLLGAFTYTFVEVKTEAPTQPAAK